MKIKLFFARTFVFAVCLGSLHTVFVTKIWCLWSYEKCAKSLKSSFIRLKDSVFSFFRQLRQCYNNSSLMFVVTKTCEMWSKLRLFRSKSRVFRLFKLSGLHKAIKIIVKIWSLQCHGNKGKWLKSKFFRSKHCVFSWSR